MYLREARFVFSFNTLCFPTQYFLSCTVHESTALYRLSLPLVKEILRSKIDALVDEATGVFGPLRSTDLGVKKLSDPELKTEEKEKSMSEFPTVARGLAREGLGDGLGVSVEIQQG